MSRTAVPKANTAAEEGESPPVAPPLLADQFLYTAASFGYSGSEGFQFVGLPVRGASAEDLERIERHVGYAAPLDAPDEPDDATIARQFPVSTRLLGPEAGQRAAIVSSRYAGRVYRAEGRRGKWGNFLVHALLLDPSDAAPALAALALEVPWRTGLSADEHAAARALELESLSLAPARESGEADDADRQLLAGVILRLCGGPPVLLPDLRHELALASYARVQALLPAAALRRLSWSSYEFDGASGYDVVATYGRSQLSMSPGGYFLPGETAPPADAAWAAACASRDPLRFWQLVAALAGPALEAAALANALSVLKRFDDPGGPDARVARDTLATLRSAPAGEALVAQARRLFEQAFPSERMTGFAAIATAFSEAKALSAWSREDGWSETVAQAASESPALLACFDVPPDVQPLLTALRDTAASGLAPEEAALAAIEAADPHLAAGRGGGGGAFIQTLQAFLQQASPSPAGNGGWVKLLARLARSPRHQPIASALWLAQAEAAGSAWFEAVRTGLRYEAPAFADSASPPLMAHLVEFYSTRRLELAWCIDAIAWLGTDGQGPLATLLARLDAQIAGVGDKARRAELAARLVQLYERVAPEHRPAESSIAHSALLDAARDPQKALRLADDDARYETLGKAAGAEAWCAVAEAAWRAGRTGAPVAAKSRQRFCTLWRHDIGPPFSDAVKLSLAGELRQPGAMAVFVEEALAAGRGGSALAQRAWIALIEALALQLATRLKDAEFERLVSSRGVDAQLRQALRARRASSLRGLPGTIGRFVQGVLGRSGERRGRGR